MKPTVGFKLPWAGVTPAPSTNRTMARTPLCSQILFRVAFFLCHPQDGEGDLGRVFRRVLSPSPLSRAKGGTEQEFQRCSPRCNDGPGIWGSHRFNCENRYSSRRIDCNSARSARRCSRVHGVSRANSRSSSLEPNCSRCVARSLVDCDRASAIAAWLRRQSAPLKNSSHD